MIPMVFHFAYFRGATDWPWLDFHTLCLKSCQSRSGAEKIIVHYDRDGEGAAWDAAKAIPNIEWRVATTFYELNGHPLTDQRVMVDYYRLQILYNEGGFFCDLDFMFLKNMTALRHSPAVIGTICQQKKKLGCGLMACVPGSEFIKAYIESYKDWNPAEQKKVWVFASVVPWMLSLKHPVTVLKRSAFYPLAWSNKTFWLGQPINIKNSYCIHLWESGHPHMTVPLLMNTCLAPEIAKVMGEPLKPALVQVRSGILSFD
jgi:hypothetical protein